MNKIRNANWSLVFDKLGTVLWDRRFWIRFIFPTVMALGVFPYLADANAEHLTDQAIAWSKLIVETVVPFVSAQLLGASWTNRPPSGLGYKELVSELGSKLRDLGIE